MYSLEFLHSLHGELQRALPACEVLLGGSYIYGEPTSRSDVDFFVICPWRGFLGLKKKVMEFKKKYPGLDLNIMVVPKFLLPSGYYYVYGRNFDGKLITGGYNREMIVGSALKLAYFEFLNFLLAKTKEAKLLAFEKICKKIGIICSVTKFKSVNLPPLSHSFTFEYLPKDEKYSIVRETLSDRQKNRPVENMPEKNLIETWLKEMRELSEPFLGFNRLNYLIYNLKFLIRGRALFLLANPDTIILQKMQEFLKEGGNLRSQINEIREIVFPVIMY